MGIVLDSNSVPFYEADNSYDGVFDLYVEIISDAIEQAEERDASLKKGENEEAGTKEYYILDDSRCETAFYRLNESGLYEEIKPIDGDIIQSEVLPGFQFRISDLYRMPSMHELVKDELYQDYILVYHQEYKRREALTQQACMG